MRVFYFYFIGNFGKAGDTYLMSKRNRNLTPEGRLAIAQDVKDIVSEAIIHNVTRIVSEAVGSLAIVMVQGFSNLQSQINDIRENMVTKAEFNEFKEGVYEFKEEMTMFKYEMYEFRDNMLEFKSNMINFKGETEPVLFSLQTDMMEVKRRLVKIEDDTLETREEIISFRRAALTTLRDHETRICVVEQNLSS
jgi:hypothetical protein